MTDWFPTFLGLAKFGPGPSRREPYDPRLDLGLANALDGVDQWPCLQGHSGACSRDEVLLNFNPFCDPIPSTDPYDYVTEAPAPKV